MTAPAPLPPGPAPQPGPGLGRSFVVVAGLVARAGTTRTRVGLLAAFAVLGVVAAALGASDLQSTVDLTGQIDDFVLRFLAPVTALIFATAVFGDMVDDGTLVYLWLRPVRRWATALGATAAPLATSAVLVLPGAAAFALAAGGDANETLAAVAASAVALVAYVPVFVALGLRVRRSLLWGLAYVLIWEGAVSPNSDTLAAFSIRTYSRSVLTGLTDTPVCTGAWTDPFPCSDVYAVSVGVAVVVAVVAGIGGVAWTTRRLRVQDIP